MSQSEQQAINRALYLAAMGVDSYVSRYPLPGAAPTRRLAIRSQSVSPAAAVQAPKTATLSTAPAASAPPRREKPPLSARELPEDSAPVAATASGEMGVAGTVPAETAQDVPIFSLAASFVGGWYWLDEIGAGRSLAPDYARLLQAICHALGLSVDAPVAEQFNWPIGGAGQLDQGAAAATAALAGFIQGRLERFSPDRVILMGDFTGSGLEASTIPLAVSRISVSAWRMLRQPELKRQAWRELKQIPADAG